MSGEGTKVFSRFLEQGPRELKTQEGIEPWQGVKALSTVTDRRSEYPEDGVTHSGVHGATREQESVINGMRGGTVERQFNREAGKTPEVKSRTWLWDETSPQRHQRSKPSRV
jgi:hypothetical protein